MTFPLIFSSQAKLSKRKDTSGADLDYGPPAEEANFTACVVDMPEEEFDKKREDFMASLKKTEEEIRTIEKCTLGQNRNPLWVEHRAKRLTASHFGTICRMRESTSCANTVKNILYQSFRGNDHTRWGNANETNALSAFEERYSTSIPKPQQSGIFIDKDEGIFAASPDALVGTDALVEIKCPLGPKESPKYTVSEAIAEKKIKFAECVDGRLILKRNHPYFYQVQGQLQITSRKSCYFVVWTKKNENETSTAGSLLVEEIHRDDAFWNEHMFPKLRSFYFHCLLPEIIDPRYARNLPIRNPVR